MKQYHPLLVSLTGLFLLAQCITPRDDLMQASLPVVPREFRAAWVASVANINWPSSTALSVDSQKMEALNYLDLLQKHHYNAVIFQVRPQCDALYDSTFEPWSYYLTGVQGQAPDPNYDPLKFWIDQAHQRGLELHAWLNPYRAHHPSGGEVTKASIVHRKPELVLSLKHGYWWLDPTLQETQDHTYAVVMDLVKRYDLDGIHFDDYFYPYPAYNDNADFPDSTSWHKYLSSGGRLSRGDWRRSAVNEFIERTYKGIKKEKPYVKFGISPFGIWRPGFPNSIQGFDQYTNLYADAKLWFNKGWVDYFSPQLYWPVNQIPQSFPVLLQWWKDQNRSGRHLWPGLSIGRIKGGPGRDEVLNQIMIARGMLKQAAGNIHWSIGPLLNRDSLADAISNGPYQGVALVPSMPWLSKRKPTAPRVAYDMQEGALKLDWSASRMDHLQQIIVYQFFDSKSSYDIVPVGRSQVEIGLPQTSHDPSHALKQVGVTVVDRFGQESTIQIISVK